jgi:hypothetical protein
VTTGFQSVGTKLALGKHIQKQKIEAYKAMGIAWENSPWNQEKSTAEEIRDLILIEGEMPLGAFRQKYEEKYKKKTDPFRDGRVGETLQVLAQQSGLFTVEARPDSGLWLVPKKV